MTAVAFPSCRMRDPANMRPKNQSHETTIHDVVNNTRSKPLYFNALVPMTPTISKMACGLSKDTDSANKICFFIGKAFASSVSVGVERQIETLIYSKNNIPAIINTVRKPSICKMMSDNPSIASSISTVSQIAAVIVAGNALSRLGCVAPCENIKTFCTPNGKIKPNANSTPCNTMSNVFTPFFFDDISLFISYSLPPCFNPMNVAYKAIYVLNMPLCRRTWIID